MTDLDYFNENGFVLKRKLFSKEEIDKLNNNNKPEIRSTKNNKISNIFFSISKVPPIKAIGTDPIKYGVNNLRFKFPALI